MTRSNLYSLFLVILLVSCSPKIRSNLANTTFSPLGINEEVIFLEITESVPENSVFIGEIKIGDSGFSTDCGYNKVIEEAKETAK